MLLQNKTIEAQYPLRQSGGARNGERSILGANNTRKLNKYVGDASIAQFNAVPQGYIPGYAWEPSKTDGGLAVFNGIECTGIIYFGNLAGGYNLESNTIIGSGLINNANLGLIVSAVATLIASGTLSASINSALMAAANLAASGNITASLGAIADIVGQITATANTNAVLNGKASGSATIRSYSDLTPENIAQLVWNSLTANFTTIGTMGKAMGDAGGSGNPWSSTIAGNTSPGTFGEAVSEVKKVTLNKMVVANNKLYVYDDNGIDIIKTFDLLDGSGNPTMTNVFQRIPE